MNLLRRLFRIDADFESPLSDELRAAKEAERRSEAEKEKIEQLFSEVVERNRKTVAQQRRELATLYLRMGEREREHAGN